MKNIVIIGAGGFGTEVLMLIDDINEINKIYNFQGFYDDGVEKGVIINNFPVLGNLIDLLELNSQTEVIIAVGNSKVRNEIVNKIKINKNLSFPNLIHPETKIQGFGNSFGKGNVITKGNILTCNITIGDFMILNLSCTIGHDTKINNFVSVMPGVNISGEVIIEENVYIGTGSTLSNKIKIGKNTIVGAGSVVLKDLPSNCTALGIPAKAIKFNDEY